MALFLNFRVSPIGGAIASAPKTQTSDDTFALAPIDPFLFKRSLVGRNVLFVAHGYNNHQSEGVCALSRLEAALDLPPSAVVVGILWPGDSHAGFVSYPVEKPTARLVGRQLAAFCNNELSGIASVSFASHSLGARLVLEAIRGLRSRVHSACLMAAAIERTCLEEEYADAFDKTDRIDILASEKDLVLRLAFPLGNFFGHVLDPTSNPLSNALGFSGPRKAIGKTARPWQISATDRYAHGNYLPSSNPEDPIPPRKPPIDDAYREAAKYMEPVNFIRRTFSGERQTWPVPG